MSDKPVQCWLQLQCEQTNCPAYHSTDPPCWLRSDTHCRNEGAGEFEKKIEDCLACEVFTCNITNPSLTRATCQIIREQFQKYRDMIEQRDRERAETLQEMKGGLTDVFKALNKIAAGDPTIRIEESSKLDLIRQLKHLVNATAENLGEIVDLSHEFAIGLAEHFDVLHRVSIGDFSTRVKGVSSVELLESLKRVTNKTISSVERKIAERKETEAELRNSEARFRRFAEKLPIGVSILRPDFSFDYLNQTFTEIFGYSIENLPDGNTWWEKIYPDNTYRISVKQLFYEARETAARGEETKPDFLTVTCKNGHEKIVCVRLGVLSDGNHFVTYEDVTERVRAEEALKESEAKHRLLIENIQDGVFIIQNETFEFVNEAMANMLGYSPAEMIGLPIRLVIAPEDQSRVEDNYKRRINNEPVEREYTFQMLHKGGHSRLFVQINVSSFLYRNRPAVIGIIKDITQKMRDDQEKKKLEERLRRSRHMEAIGTLAGGVAHDLNNILSGIVSYPELLLYNLPQDSPLRKPLQTIKKSGEKASAIVQDLLTLARRAVSTSDIVRLNDIISEYLTSPEMERLQSFHPNVRVAVDLAPDLLNINGSPVHLSKTVMNLVSNAAESMPDGGTIHVSTANRHIDRTVKMHAGVEEGDYVTLRVMDTGVGISQEDLDRIFEPFYTKKAMGRSGTGLGMAVVWGTVKDHHGYIDVTSEEMHGTTFTLYFPGTRKEVHQQADHLSIEKYYGQGESVLVVDDVAEQREIASAILAKLGYKVHTAASGEDALQFLRNQRVDLVVLDMIMEPGIDGLETYQRILQICPGQKTIVASGFSLSDRVKKIQGLGAGAYLKKPYSLEGIARAVRHELEK